MIESERNVFADERGELVGWRRVRAERKAGGALDGRGVASKALHVAVERVDFATVCLEIGEAIVPFVGMPGRGANRQLFTRRAMTKCG